MSAGEECATEVCTADDTIEYENDEIFKTKSTPEEFALLSLKSNNLRSVTRGAQELLC